jgi:hypothetical protein
MKQKPPDRTLLDLVLDGFRETSVVRRAQMKIESAGIVIDFVQNETTRVFGLNENVETPATALVLKRGRSIDAYEFAEAFGEGRLDQKFSENDEWFHSRPPSQF